MAAHLRYLMIKVYLICIKLCKYTLLCGKLIYWFYIMLINLEIIKILIKNIYVMKNILLFAVNIIKNVLINFTKFRNVTIILF